MTTDAPSHRSRARARAAARRASGEIARLGREARPWLRREQWTRESLAALAASARSRPRRALALLGRRGRAPRSPLLGPRRSRTDLRRG